MDRKGGEKMRGRKLKSERLVPLRVMVSPEHIVFLNVAQKLTGKSQGGIIRQLINNEQTRIEDAGEKENAK